MHVGCGNGEIDVALALATPGLDVISMDLHHARARHTRELADEVGATVRALAGDLAALPIAPGSADAVLCIGVLQHLPEPATAAKALAALLRPGGRILVVEPDHEARYWYSASPAGEQAFDVARGTLGQWHRQVAPDAPSRLGVHVVSWLREADLEPLSIEALPVAESRLGAPPPGVWEARERILTAIASAPGREGDGTRLLEALADYRESADAQGAAFVEVQHALLIATLAQRRH